MSRDVPIGDRRIAELAEGLRSILSPMEREALGGLLATDLIHAADAALAKLVAIEEENEDIEWSSEVLNLQDTLEVARKEL